MSTRAASVQPGALELGHRVAMNDQWRAEIAAYLTHLAGTGRAKTTVYAYRQRLEHLARGLFTGPWEATDGEVAGYLAQQNWARETRRGRIDTIKGFYAWGRATRRTRHDPARALEKVQAGDPAPRPVPDRVYLEALMRADEDERVWIDLAAEHGLRRAEVACVHSDDLRETLLGWDLLVRGKGGKRRLVPLTHAMARELLERARVVGGGWLFPGADGGHVSPRWVGTRVARLLDGDWTMHKLRHRAATRFWIESDGDAYLVADLMGWANIAMVRVYVAIPDERRRAVVERASRLGVPVTRSGASALPS